MKKIIINNVWQLDFLNLVAAFFLILYKKYDKILYRIKKKGEKIYEI